jgi:hypothetical protein
LPYKYCLTMKRYFLTWTFVLAFLSFFSQSENMNGAGIILPQVHIQLLP